MVKWLRRGLYTENFAFFLSTTATQGKASLLLSACKLVYIFFYFSLNIYPRLFAACLFFFQKACLQALSGCVLLYFSYRSVIYTYVFLPFFCYPDYLWTHDIIS